MRPDGLRRGPGRRLERGSRRSKDRFERTLIPFGETMDGSFADDVFTGDAELASLARELETAGAAARSESVAAADGRPDRRFAWELRSRLLAQLPETPSAERAPAIAVAAPALTTTLQPARILPRVEWRLLDHIGAPRWTALAAAAAHV